MKQPRSEHPAARAVTSGARHLLAIKDHNGIYRAANPAFGMLVGRHSDDITGCSDYELFPNEQAARNRQHDHAALEAGRSLSREENVATATGSWRLLVTRTPLKTSGPLHRGVLVSALDLHSPETAASAPGSHHPPDIYRALVSNMTDAVAIDRLIRDDQGRAIDWVIEDVNEAFEKVMRLPRSEAVNRRAEQVYGQDAALWLSTYAQVVEEGAPIRFTRHFKNLDGYFAIEALPLGGDHFATIAHDVTDLKMTEHQLRRSRDELKTRLASMQTRRASEPPSASLTQLQATLGSIRLALIVGDVHGQVLDMNPSACRLFGTDRLEDVQNRHLYEYRELNGRHVAAEDWPLELARRGENRHDWILQVRRTDTGATWVGSFDCHAVRDHEVAVTLAVVGVRDVTNEHRAERERQFQEANVRESQKLESLGMLAGGIAHDFNNLLVGMLGNADLALMDLPNDCPSRRMVENIKTIAMRASELTSQMLAYSGRARFEIAPIDLNAVLEDVLRLLQSSVSKNAKLEVELANDLPAIEADQTQIRQVVMNLVTNASDALGTEPGRIRVRTGNVQLDRAALLHAVHGQSLPEGWYTFLEVTDTGRGMDPETKNRVFEPFFTSKRTGRGLGLAVVLGIVRSHKGAIQLETKRGGGTTFRILFPSAGPCVRRAPEQVAPRSKPQPATGVILVVDDEEIVRNVARTMLEHIGYRVHTAAHGAEAVELVGRHGNNIDAVLLDLTMPVMGGEEAFQKMRAIRPDLPVLLASGYSEQEAMAHFAGRGVAGFVSKPFEFAVLADKLRAIIEPAPRAGA